jgi:hypothetical protein
MAAVAFLIIGLLVPGGVASAEGVPAPPATLSVDAEVPSLLARGSSITGASAPAPASHAYDEPSVVAHSDGSELSSGPILGAHATRGTSFDPSDIRFSQTSVNQVDEIAASMRSNGWVGKPVDAVRMPDGGLTTLNNSRVLAAHEAGIDVQAAVRGFDDAIPGADAAFYPSVKGDLPSTWGEAITNRIGRQSVPYRTRWPSGSPFTGWDGS